MPLIVSAPARLMVIVFAAEQSPVSSMINNVVPAGNAEAAQSETVRGAVRAV